VEEDIPPFAEPASAPAPAPAQPYGPPPQLASPAPVAVSAPSPFVPPAPPRRRLTRASVIGIVAGAVALLLIITGAVVASSLVLQTFGHHSSAGAAGSAAPSVPHTGGVTSSETARTPLQCSANFFADNFSIPGDTVPSPSAFTALGLTKTIDSLGDYSSSTAADEYDGTLTGWEKAKGTPPECFFTYFQSPVVAAVGDRPSVDTTEIDYTGTHSDKGKNNILTQAVRIFANSADADSYLQQLSAAIAACRSYQTSDSSGSLDVAVKPITAFHDFPRSEAAVGWVESSYGSRYESIDVQRGNLVVRTSFESYDDTVSETQFRSFVVDDAWQIAAMLTPGAGH
jgi:hypothetical protein